MTNKSTKRSRSPSANLPCTHACWLGPSTWFSILDTTPRFDTARLRLLEGTWNCMQLCMPPLVFSLYPWNVHYSFQSWSPRRTARIPSLRFEATSQPHFLHRLIFPRLFGYVQDRKEFVLATKSDGGNHTYFGSGHWWGSRCGTEGPSVRDEEEQIHRGESLKKKEIFLRWKPTGRQRHERLPMRIKHEDINTTKTYVYVHQTRTHTKQWQIAHRRKQQRNELASPTCHVEKVLIFVTCNKTRMNAPNVLPASAREHVLGTYARSPPYSRWHLHIRSSFSESLVLSLVGPRSFWSTFPHNLHACCMYPWMLLRKEGRRILLGIHILPGTHWGLDMSWCNRQHTQEIDMTSTSEQRQSWSGSTFHHGHQNYSFTSDSAKSIVDDKKWKFR
jgi:hypothetical protein